MRIPKTRASLFADLRRLGVQDGDMVMVHAAMSKVGPSINGPDSLIGALADSVGPSGTILAYSDWNGSYDEFLDGEGFVLPEWRGHIPPFDPQVSRANRDNGILPEFLRTTPGAQRSGNPGASIVALGAQSNWLTSDHPLDYGYGEGSPFEKLVSVAGKVLMIGAPLDTMTLLHHAEHLARIPNKRLRRYQVPLRLPSGTSWTMIEEFDTSDPVVAGLSDDYFGDIVSDFIEKGSSPKGLVGDAPSILVDAYAIVRFAVEWLEEWRG